MKKKNLQENQKNPQNKTLKLILITLLAIGIVSGSTVAIYVNSMLDKVNYEGEINMSVDPNLEEEEKIDFSIDETTTSAPDKKDDSDKAPDKNTSTTKPSTNKTSDNLVAIYKVENGVNKEYKVPADKLKQEAAVIQQQADKDIQQNITNDTSIWYSDDVYNLLIVGYDAGEKEAVMFEGMQYPRSDSMIIASINKKKKTIKLVSLSRATYVAIKDHGNKRLNTAHAFGGAKTLIETIESNYKVRIDNYVSVDFKGFSSIIDAMNGVSVDMSAIEANYAFNKEDLKAGNYTLNGKQALRFVRLRQTDSDRQRTGRQRKVLTSIFDKFKTQSLTQQLDFMETVLPYVTTDMNKGQLSRRIAEAQSYLEYNLTEDIIPHNAIKLTLKEGKEVIILDWAETTSYIHKILYDGVEVKKIEA
ncbi:MAG: LCP family protein [Clostridia bacterium]|nr:LCP family protein [Clostridia bacterium]